MAVTMLTYPENLEGSITILGETGSVQIGGVAANEIKTWKFADKRDYDEEIKSANCKLLLFMALDISNIMKILLMLCVEMPNQKLMVGKV